MGTIIERPRRNGTVAYKAELVVKRKGVTYREAKTFDRKQAASAWLERREAEMSAPGAVLRQKDPTLGEVIDQYTDESEKKIGRTKAQVLRSIKAYDIAAMRCSTIKSEHLVAFTRALKVHPSTRQNYLSHLSAIFAIAKPAWGYPLDRQAIQDAFIVTKRMGVTSKGRKRERRPTLDELDCLMDHYGRGDRKADRRSPPMQQIIRFAMFSTRRQEEITRLLWKDYEPRTEGHAARVLVRDMKHPGDKIGNDTWCELPDEAAAFIEGMPRIAAQIFPYKRVTISSSFTNACKFLGIDDLRFHDLRHEGASWLFEKGGRDIPQVAKVTGHRHWSSLQRYSHIRQTGDKYANWKWRTP